MKVRKITTYNQLGEEENILGIIGRDGFVGKNVSAILGKGTESSPISLTSVVDDYTTLYFERGVYYVSQLEISNKTNITFLMNDATIHLTGDAFVTATNCPYISFYGGKISGNNSAVRGVFLTNCKNATIENVSFENFGNASTEGASMLNLFGDCTGFRVLNSTFNNCTSGVVGTDGYIHAWGIFVNRLSTGFSKEGVISGCTISNIAGTDSSEKKADGDGIFVQAPPFLNSDGSVEWRRDHKIIIENCVFKDCKKRAIKCAATCVTVRGCTISGAMWNSGIDARFGHLRVYDTYINNTSDYDGSFGCCIITCDGDFVADGCTFSAKYADGSYRNAIRIDTRFSESVVPATMPYEKIRISNCFFDNVGYAVNAYSSGAKMKLTSIEIENCRIGKFKIGNPFFISNTLIETIVVTNWEFDAGKNRTEVKSEISEFTYPITFNVDPTICCEIHSTHWESEPISNITPTSPNGYIEFTGNIGGIVYKKYASYGSQFVGTADPMSVASTLGKQLLYKSKVGDIYKNKQNATVWICSMEGTSNEVGTWKQLSGTTTETAQNGNDILY